LKFAANVIKFVVTEPPFAEGGSEASMPQSDGRCMMNRLRAFLLVLALALIAFKTTAADTPPPPYLYYFSPSESQFRVERADGSDSRTFGSIAYQEGPYFLNGPGWSPDGNWFAFNIYPPQNPNAFVIDIRSDVEQPILMWNAHAVWSPNSRFLLISGNIDLCDGYCSQQTNWLYDVANGEILAWLDFRRGASSPGSTPIEWDLENGQVVFYGLEDAFGQRFNYYRITMLVTGEVIKQPISFEVYDALFADFEDPPCCPTEMLFTSPSGSIVISSRGELTNTETGESMQLPAPTLEPMERAEILDVIWEASETWALLHYDTTLIGADSISGVDLVSVVKNDGSDYRQLTICGASPACVGWLPEVVNIEAIATGSG
jgi:hypothetical protein